MTLRQEKVENTKVVMISRKSKKDRQSNGQNEKNNNTINALQYTRQKTIEQHEPH